MSILRTVSLAFAAVAAFAFQTATHAQSWPAKPVRIISVFPPGGSVDQVARIFAAKLTEQMHQQFIVENRGGASGSIGTQAVAAATPDHAEGLRAFLEKRSPAFGGGRS